MDTKLLTPGEDTMKQDPEVVVMETLEKYAQYVNPGLARILKFSGVIQEERTEGTYMYDNTGKRYIDFFSGHGVYNLGYIHPRVVKAVEDQLRKIPLTSSRLILNRTLADLCEKLAKITPGDLTYSFICNSGAEAVEAALKLARISTGKPRIIGTINGFHGKSMGALSASGKRMYKEPFEPLVPCIDHVPYGDIEAMKAAVTDDTAAIIVEPIQGEAGVICPPDGYLREIRGLCNEKGVLLILDEVQTGMGRTGKMFACEHEGIAPDIMTLAKALGGGIMPIGACIATPEVFVPFEENPFIHSSTNQGNPMACAAAIATIDTLIEEDLPRQAAEKGAYIISRLHDIKNEFPNIIKEIRGKGLIIGVEFVDEGFVGSTTFELGGEGILILHMLNNHKAIRLEPPLIISYEQIDFMLKVFRNAMQTNMSLYE